MSDISFRDIIEADLKELWNMVKLYEDDFEAEDKENYILAKEGVIYEFPIQYVFDKNYEKYPSSKRVKILGFGKVPIVGWYEEVEQREKALRQILIKQALDGDPYETETGE